MPALMELTFLWVRLAIWQAYTIHISFLGKIRAVRQTKAGKEVKNSVGGGGGCSFKLRGQGKPH